MKRWSVLLGCFIGMGVATPAILLVPMGLYLKSVTVEFGWSRTAFSVIIATAALSNVVILPIAGYLVDRFGPLRIIAIGTTLGCGSYAALSLAGSYGTFIAIVVLSVVTGNLASYPAFMTLAQRWFDKRLGLALALTSTGLAAGTGGFSYLIATTIQSRGWRAAFVTAGVLALVIGIANLLLFVRDNDAQMPEAERREGLPVDGGSSLGAALCTRDFWLYAVGFLLVVFTSVGVNFHLPALLSDRGASAVQIASVVAIGSAGSLFGRLFTGIALDRFSVLRVSGTFFLGQSIGLLLLLDGMQWASVSNFLLGAVQGAEIDLLGYVMARRFGRAAYARILGANFSVTLLGAVFGPIVMAAIFDRTRSYNLGLMLFPLLPVLAWGLLSATRSISSGAAEASAPLTVRPS